MTARADSVVAVFRDLLVDLGVQVDVARATTELAELLEGPWAAFCQDPGRHRSALTESGAPFELSLKLGLDGDLSLRYVVDVADPGVDLAGNVDRYLTAARLTTRQPDESLSRLLSCQIGDVSPGTPARLMQGVGWASGDRRRGTLYFPAAWLTPEELAHRLPGPTVLPGSAQVVGYDFDDHGLTSWKTYHWLLVDPATALADHADVDRVPFAAGVVHDRFAAGVPAGVRGTSTFLQRRVDGSGVQDRLFFFARPWGWASPSSVAELLALLSSLGLDLGPLRAVAACTRRHGLPVHVGLVSVGGHEVGSVTFYFWPT
jgi:hypothetical protein